MELIRGPAKKKSLARPFCRSPRALLKGPPGKREMTGEVATEVAVTKEVATMVETTEEETKFNFFLGSKNPEFFSGFFHFVTFTQLSTYTLVHDRTI